MRCNFCGGAAHPATGCQYGQRVIACRSCTESFWRWVDKHTASRRTKARRETVEGMKVFELTQDEYERQSVAIAGTAGTLVIVRQRNGERRIIRFPQGRPMPSKSFYEAAAT